MPVSRAELPRSEEVWAIGFDGGDFRVLDVFAERGWMPHLQGLMQAGSTSSLHSTLPPITAPAWTSFLTGCNPGRHGVFAFREPMVGQRERPIVNGSSVRASRIWEYLDAFGLSTGLVNVPMTYPVEPLRGYMVAGMLAPEGDRALAFPEDVQSMLRAQNYIVDLQVGRRERQMETPEEIIALADDLIVSEQRRVDAALQLLAQRPTDFCAIVFVATDRIQHAAWNYIERLLAEPDAAQNDAVCQRVWAVYQQIDDALGSLLARRSAGTTVIILSDHGFTQLHTRVHLNDWLAQQGWLEFDQAARTARRYAKRGRAWLKRHVPRRLLLWGRRTLAAPRTIHWTGTVAYAGDASENAVYLNVQGREPQGMVSAAEYENVLSAVVAALAGLRDPRNGHAVIRRVLRRDEAYSGPFSALAPDIMLEPEEGYEITPEVAQNGLIFADVRNEGKGMHARDGILVAAGHGIRQSHARGVANIADITPTALYLLGLPAPCEMDGRVLETILAPDWLLARPPQVEAFAEQLPSRAGSDKAVYGPREQGLIEERLSGLGYF